jgi:HD-GYP domain-containing protein (c-di-GMP phosphodiesterase class II)
MLMHHPDASIDGIFGRVEVDFLAVDEDGTAVRAVHHEWWNGQGYPLGLKEEQIPFECRILAIADAFDAMTSNRPYRAAMSGEVAKKELVRYAGIQFDPKLVFKTIDFLT